MTEQHRDDESLSAALDGEDSATAAHVAGCARCRARADALDLARRAVGGGHTAAPPAVADRAVAAALAAFATERAGPAATPTPATADAVVVPFRPAPAPPTAMPGSFSSRPAPTSGGRGRRVPGWAMGAAAAVLALLVAVPVLNRDSGTDPDQVAATRGEARRATTEAAAPVVDGGDLGDQADQLALGQVLAGSVAGAAPASPAPETMLGPGPAADDAQRAAPTRTSQAGGDEAPSIAAPAPATAQPSVAPYDGAGADPAAVAACGKVVTTEYGTGLGPLLYRATLRWQGTPSVLFAYRLADTSAEGPDHRAFVMAIDGCRLLVVQGF